MGVAESPCRAAGLRLGSPGPCGGIRDRGKQIRPLAERFGRVAGKLPPAAYAIEIGLSEIAVCNREEERPDATHAQGGGRKVGWGRESSAPRSGGLRISGYI